MTKKEYFKQRLRRNFLDFSLIQSDTLSAPVIADNIVGSVNLEDLYLKLKTDIDIICENFFSIELLKSEGRITNDMPESFNLDVKKNALAEFQKILDDIDIKSVISEQVGNAFKAIELECWHNGVSEISEAIRLVGQKLRDIANDYKKMNELIEFNDKDLEARYDAARRVTMMERMMDNNCDDILMFRTAMMLNTKAHCMEMCNNKMSFIYNEFSKAEAFTELASYLTQIANRARIFADTMQTMTPNEEWDKEYNQMVPVEFYRRNASLINMEHAFHMVLLSVFARNEEWMLANGFLKKNELCIFTKMDEEMPQKVVSKVEETIMI
ncbi:MAG: hypothetical protein Q4F69_07615 [Bacteroidia bacterium]|nr:hypothetical protein [Bacteroidia bacterium]